MHIIDIAIRNKIAVNTNKTEYVCGNDDFIVRFDFDAEWDDFVHKTARFISNGAYADVIFSGNECAVPVHSGTNTILCGVYAGDLRTTTPALIPARKSILCGSPAPAEPTPEVFAQMVEMLNAAYSVPENAKAAGLSAEKAKESEEAAAQSAEAAAESAKEAKRYAVPSDFDQNDETQPDHIKNRTHWKAKITATVALNNAGVLVDGDTPYYLYKVSDAVVTDGDSFIGAVVSAYNGALKWTMNKAERIPVSYGNSVVLAYMGSTVYFVSTTAEAFNAHIGSEVLSEDGTYLKWSVLTEDLGVVATVETGEVVSVLPKKFLPPLPESAGENVEGKKYTVDGNEVTAMWGAEVFNDYENNISAGPFTHAEGSGTVAEGSCAHAEGEGTTASRVCHAEGYKSKALGAVAHAEGFETTASGMFGAHSEGQGTVAASTAQHVQGKYNIEDANNKYAHIVGNGTSDSNRSNAHTVDWEGNGWFAGSVEAPFMVLVSPNGTRFKITVDDNGALTATAL